MIFGAGLGYREVEFKGFGTTQAERVARLEENLEAVVRLWTEDGVTMAGSHFTLDDATVSLKPMQKPHPPIWLGANADAAVERAARLGDSWFINPHQRMETTERQLTIYRRALDEASRPFPEELPLMREIFVARTRAEAERLARPYLEEKYKTYHQWGQDKAMPAGDDDLSLDFEELMRDRFLFGSPDEVAEQIAGYNRRLGITTFILGMDWLGMPARASHRQHAALRRRGGAAGRRRRLGPDLPNTPWPRAFTTSTSSPAISRRPSHGGATCWAASWSMTGCWPAPATSSCGSAAGGLHLYDQPPRDRRTRRGTPYRNPQRRPAVPWSPA